MAFNCELSVSEETNKYIHFTIDGSNTKNGKEYGYYASIGSDTDFTDDRYWSAANFARNAWWCLRSVEESRAYFGSIIKEYPLKKEYTSIEEFEEDDAALIGLVTNAEGFPDSLCLKTIEESGSETVALECYLDPTHDANYDAEECRKMFQTAH